MEALGTAYYDGSTGCGGNPNRRARRTVIRISGSLYLVRIPPMWTLIVPTVTPQRSAICIGDSPSTMARRIFHSIAVSSGLDLISNEPQLVSEMVSRNIKSKIYSILKYISNVIHACLWRLSCAFLPRRREIAEVRY